MGDSGVGGREGGSGTLVAVSTVDDMTLVVTVGGSCWVASLCDVLSDSGVMEAVQ